MRICLTVNGQEHTLELPARTTLLEALRGPLDLTAAKPACDVGDCGACAVLVAGEPTLSCITLAALAQGQPVVTAEGLTPAEGLHPVQQAFHDAGAAQCGYCTPGLIVAGAALLLRTPHPDEAQVREALSGNLCRCTGYTRIVEAMLKAACPQEAMP